MKPTKIHFLDYLSGKTKIPLPELYKSLTIPGTWNKWNRQKMYKDRQEQIELRISHLFELSKAHKLSLENLIRIYAEYRRIK